VKETHRGQCGFSSASFISFNNAGIIQPHYFVDWVKSDKREKRQNLSLVGILIIRDARCITHWKRHKDKRYYLQTRCRIEAPSLLGCCTMRLGSCCPMFRRKALPSATGFTQIPPIFLKMKAVVLSETSGRSYPTTWCNNTKVLVKELCTKAKGSYSKKA